MDWKNLSVPGKLPFPIGCGVALLSVALATLVRLLLDPYVDDSVPYVTYFLAIALTTWFTGFRPSLLAIALSFLTAVWFFVPPRHSFLLSGFQWAAGGMFLAANLVFAALAQAMRQARERADAHARTARQRQQELEVLLAERKQYEEETLRAKQAWERTFDSVPDLIAIMDPQHRIVRANRAMANRLGQISAEQYVGLKCHQCVHGAPHPPGSCPLTLTLQDGREHAVELYEERLGGYFLVSTTPFFDEHQKMVGLVHVARDITERKRMEEKLCRTNERLEAILDHTHMLVACLDREFNFLVVNRAYAQADGREPEFFPGKNHFALYPHAENEVIFRQVVETGQPYFTYGKPFEYAARPEQGTSYWDWSLIPVKDARGRVTQVVMTLLDVTKPIEAQEALCQAQRELHQHNTRLEHMVAERTAALRETVAQLESFSYTISHDLRAPVRSMRMFSAMLIDECAEAGAKAKDFAARIARSAQRMDCLIQDILCYSRITRDKLTLEPVDARALLRDLVETYPELHPSNADITIKGEFPPLLANLAALTQCFSNLLGNAVKFVAPGTRPKISIWAERVAGSESGRGRMEDGGWKRENIEHSTLNIEHRSGASDPSINHQPSTINSFIRLWFADNGIGIDGKYQEKIFGIFERLDPRYEGTGIGLAIVRKAVQRMGGNVGVESEPGQGSRFWLELPAA